MGDYVVRRPIAPNEIVFRGHGIEAEHLSQVRKYLRKLHAFEIMAVNIYRMQISNSTNSFNRTIIQSMANEMSHVQDFQIKLYEYGGKPSVLWWVMGAIGFCIGVGSRLLGDKMVIKTGIWTEKKAVADYEEIIDAVRWDNETLEVIKRNLSDEYHHIDTLNSLSQH